MMLADSGINLVILVIAGIITLVRWLTTKGEETPEDSKSRESARPAAAGASEEERMRRFLEALGVPAESQSPPRNRPTPRRVEPPPLHAPQNYPAPTVAHRKDFRRTPPITVAPPPVPVQERSFDEEPTTTVPAGQIHFPELHVPEVKEYVSASSTASSDREIPAAWRRETPEPVAAAGAGQWAQLVRSPRDLRNAIVLREILGPPRSLQSGGSFSTLR